MSRRELRTTYFTTVLLIEVSKARGKLPKLRSQGSNGHHTKSLYSQSHYCSHLFSFAQSFSLVRSYLERELWDLVGVMLLFVAIANRGDSFSFRLTEIMQITDAAGRYTQVLTFFFVYI